MFKRLIEWLQTPQHEKMMQRRLENARRDLVNAEELAEYYQFQTEMLKTRVFRLERELKK